MPTFKNIHPAGALELPLIGRVVDAGEIFEVTTQQAELLAAQPDVWQPVHTADPTAAELRAQLKAAGLSQSGNKETLAARLAEAARPAPAAGTDTGESPEGEGTE